MTFGLKTLPYNGTEKIEDPNNQSKRFGGNVEKKNPFYWDETPGRARLRSATICCDWLGVRGETRDDSTVATTEEHRFILLPLHRDQRLICPTSHFVSLHLTAAFL